MPYNFCVMEPYVINYEDFLETALRFPQFLANPEWQAHYIKDWVDTLAQLDAIITKQMKDDNTVKQLVKDAQEEPEVFNQPVFIGKNTFNLQFRISAVLKILQKSAKIEAAITLPIANFSNEDILWTITSSPGKTTLSEPVVLVEFPFGKYHWLVIDGNHRISTCIANGASTIMAYRLSGKSIINNKLFASGFDQYFYAMIWELAKAKNMLDNGYSDKEILSRSILFSPAGTTCFD